MAKYISYTITDFSIETVSDFLFSTVPIPIKFIRSNSPPTLNEFESSIKKIEWFTNSDFITILNQQKFAKEFLDFNDGVSSNWVKIRDSYSNFDFQENNQIYLSGDYRSVKIARGTTISIDSDLVNIEFLSFVGQNQVVNYFSFNKLYVDVLKQLQTDEKFIPKYKSENRIITDVHDNISVWLWSRNSLDDGEFIDISDFVISLNTNVTKTGGNFSLSLVPINGDSWTDLDSNFNDFYSKRINNVGGEDYVIRNNSIFYKNIKTNDLIFIRFEQLNGEKIWDRKPKDRFDINTGNISNNTYDMIALVDSIESSYTPASSDISVNIIGRDLVKLIIEDGAYSYSLQYGNKSILINKQDEDKLVKRLFNNYRNFIFVNPPIKQAIQFILNNLGNTGIIPNKVFDSYLDKTQIYKKLKSGDLVLDDAEGLYQIIKLFIDDNIADIVLTDSSLSQVDGSIYNQFQKICQEPFIEFSTDTYGSNFYFMVRRPPFTVDAIIQAIDDGCIVDIDDRDVLSDTLSFNEDDIYSWYEIRQQGLPIELPSIYLNNFVEVWGSRRLSLQINYGSYKGNRLLKVRPEDSLPYHRVQAINDLIFMLSSYIYMPFSRKGQITINGDRRIKRGTFIRYKSTNEIYYVDGVNQSYSISFAGIDRTTILHISRGLVEQYLKESSVMYNNKVISVSYDSIINLKDLRKNLDKYMKSGKISDISDNTLIEDKNVFEFFLNRKQFERFV